MSIESTPCPRCGWSEAVGREVEQRVERMLDAAETAGLDLGELDQCRQQLERDLHRLGRPRARRRDQLERSIERGFEVLAQGFNKMAAALGEGQRR